MPEPKRIELSTEDYLPAPRDTRRRITTFYSFKGGVGRSMAMQGVAMALADRGERVLMVDADIEAPGLTLAHLPEEDEGADGFVDIIGDVAEAVLDIVRTGRPVARDEFAMLSAHVTDDLVTIPRDDSAASDVRERLQALADEGVFPMPPRSCVALLPVGTVLSDYAGALARLEFDSLFDADGPAAPEDLVRAAGLTPKEDTTFHAGDIFSAVVRSALLNAVWEEDGEPFDHVFIDSRTGLADVAGVCVRWLPNHVVFICGLNEQNIRGTCRALQHAELDANDGDRVTLVWSPVPNTELQQVDKRLERAARYIGVRHECPILHYEPWLALSDQPLTEECHRHSRLSTDYGDLAETLVPSWGALPQLIPLLRPDRPDYSAATGLLARRALMGDERAEELANLAQFLLGQGSRVDEDKAVQLTLLHVIAAVLPGDVTARGMLGDALAHRAMELLEAGAPSDLEAADEFCQQACDEYRQAVHIRPDTHEAWYNWGNTLGDWAEAVAARDVGAAERLFEEACEKYRQAVEIKPDLHEAWYNWGSALHGWAQVVAQYDIDAALRLVDEACDKFRQAAEVAPDEPEVWSNWAGALMTRWHVAPDSELLEVAEQKLRRAESIRPGSATYNLACLAALRGQLDEAFAGLEQALAGEKITWAHVAQDADWEHLRQEPRYLELAEKYGSQED